MKPSSAITSIFRSVADVNMPHATDHTCFSPASGTVKLNFIFWGVYYQVFILMERAFLGAQPVAAHCFALYIAPVISSAGRSLNLNCATSVFPEPSVRLWPGEIFSLEKLLFRQNIIFSYSHCWRPCRASLIRKRFPRPAPYATNQQRYFVTSNSNGRYPVLLRPLSSQTALIPSCISL